MRRRESQVSRGEKMDAVPRRGEPRKQAFAYVFEVLAVLTVIFLPDGEHCRIVSFRPANRKEREKYRAWLEENDPDDP